MYRTVAPAITRLPSTTSVALSAATTPWVPALVRWTTRRPVRSRSTIFDGEFPTSNPGIGRPPISPVRKSVGSFAFSARACSWSPTRTTSRAPAATQNAAVVNARNTSMVRAVPTAARAPSRPLCRRTLKRLRLLSSGCAFYQAAAPSIKRLRLLSKDRRGERAAPGAEPLDREIADIEQRRLPIEHLLDDELGGRGRVHEAVAREPRGDVEARRPRHRSDDRMVVGRHLVIAGPAVGDPQVLERLHPPFPTCLHPGLELRRYLELTTRRAEHVRRRGRSLLDLAIGAEVRHREALSGTALPRVRAEVEARFELDDQRDRRELRERAGRLHEWS